jgi:two-component system, NarL family, response regulator DesR
MVALRVLLAEEAALIRGALVALIELEPDLTVVAAVERGDQILPAALSHKPDIAIIDPGLPGLDGLSVADQLHDALPDCRILLLTNLGRAEMVCRDLPSHVSGFMLLEAPPEQLATAIRDIVAGRQVLNPLLDATARTGARNPLSPQEREVLRQVAEGAGSDEIAAAMHLSVGTVRNYLTTIVTKLNARNRVDAVRTAYDLGWLP